MTNLSIILGTTGMLMALIGLANPLVAAYGLFAGLPGMLLGAYSLPSGNNHAISSRGYVSFIMSAASVTCSILAGLMITHV